MTKIITSYFIVACVAGFLAYLCTIWLRGCTSVETTPTTYETRCSNKGLLEVRLQKNNEGFTQWISNKDVLCEVAKEKPLDPKEALKVKLTTPGTCPAHCICPTTKQLDVCLVTRGMCERDLAYYKNIAPSGQGSPECLKLLDKYERLSAEYSEALDRCLRL